ncbi:hypothetical protein [Curtobacterium sp. MCBA15_004]|uniref:hypothetical protein n=1 Tax=Curtobacterium sp. MCBA15_004 TaxID=1898733 RepID=UPI0008DD45A2|nr:hypothetical protein [Curtobacterium sp. MCBA15_004]WIA98025.1 hypothetical protein QOL16_06460 [Curtobacterium sp. MCBA15_004]
MATGDAAGAAGLKVYDDTLLVADVDTALNQRGDDVAAVMGRTADLEKLTKGTPKFMVNRSSAGQVVGAEVWSQINATGWATPLKNVGGFGWSGGALTIPRAGIYEVQAHAMFRGNDYRTAAVQITRNTTQVDTDSSITANETTVDLPSVGAALHLGITASRYVSLNANDVIRVFVLQRNRNDDIVNVGQYAFDLTFDVVWVDEQ